MSWRQLASCSLSVDGSLPVPKRCSGSELGSVRRARLSRRLTVVKLEEEEAVEEMVVGQA